jgi:hypothetical protein
LFILQFSLTNIPQQLYQNLKIKLLGGFCRQQVVRLFLLKIDKNFSLPTSVMIFFFKKKVGQKVFFFFTRRKAKKLTDAFLVDWTTKKYMGP